jgi:hypothetical protein
MEKDVHMKREYIDNLNVKCLSMIKAWKPDKIMRNDYSPLANNILNIGRFPPSTLLRFEE